MMTCTICNGQVAPTNVNVADSLSFGDPMVAAFRKALPGGFYSKLTSPVNTMEHLKEGIKIGDKVVFDLESIFLRLLIVGQPIFGYEICAVPHTVQITFIFIGQTHLVFGKRVCTCVTKHSNAFRTFLNWLKNSKRVWHQPKLHILRLPIFANFDL